jgi:hypothetical protein
LEFISNHFMHSTLSNKNLAFLLLVLAPRLLWCQRPEPLRISERFMHVPMISGLNQIEAKYQVMFYYKEEWFRNDTLNIVITNNTFEESVKRILNDKPYIYRIINDSNVVFLPKVKAAAFLGQMADHSDEETLNQNVNLIGDEEDAGKSKTVVLSGQITDGKTGEPIIGATIQVNNLPQGAVSNVQGNYKLMLAPGFYTLKISSVGFEQSEYKVKIISNGSQNFELIDKSIVLDEIIVYSQRVDRNITGNQMSLIKLDAKGIVQLPAVAGGKDILKGLTTMPGIKSVGEFSSGINVRGGGEDQNLYLVNGTPLFNTSHVFGLFSVINPDIVDNLSLYKGHIPAIYGERVSSVVDIITINNAPEKLRIKGGVGLYDSRLTILVPLYKNKIFFDLSGRTSYSDWILSRMNDYNLRNSKASFYDINGTLHFNLPKNIVSVSGYLCNDAFKFASEVKYNYGSELLSVNWNHMINSSLGTYLTLSYSNYHVSKDDISSTFMQSHIVSGIQYTGLRYRMKYSGIRHHTIDAGVNLFNYLVHPGERTPLDTSSLIIPASLKSEKAYEGAVFLNDEYAVNNYLTFNAGLRISGYRKPDSGMIFGFEPRLSSRIQINDHSSVKLSYNRDYQYISMVSLSSVSTPGDIWKLANSNIKPLIANQFALGYYRNFINNTIETSVEVYYKRLSNIIEYKNGAVLEMNPDIENELLNAKGSNYGIEFLLKKNSGKIDGWISYTYSRSLRKVSDPDQGKIISNNKYFPSSYDKPHDFTIVANLHVTKRLQLSANFTYSTGRPITLPEYKYSTGGEILVVFSKRNEYRIPDYHRLDLSISFDESLRKKKKWKGCWSLSLLNVYGRKNPYTVYYKKENPSEFNNFNSFSLYKLYLIGKPIPTLNYTFVF